MNDEKLCEYLSDIGVLLFDNIDLFFEIHSKNNKNNQFKNEREKLKESLFLYLQKTSKDDNLLRHMSKQLIESYYNSKLVTKYKTIKKFINILHNKLLLTYINFIINISKYIKNKNIENKNNINDINKNNSDNNNNIFRNNPEDSNNKIYNKKAKIKIKSPKKNKRIKRTNQYKNNFYKNIQDNNINPHSFFVNNNDFYLNMYKKDFNNNNDEKVNKSNDDFHNISNIISRKYYSPIANIKSKIPINNYILTDNQNGDKNIKNDFYFIPNNNEHISNIKPEYRHQTFINNNNIDYSVPDVPDDYDFLNNEQKHIQKVQNKIMNLKNEKITQLEEQCTFTPKLNNRYKFPKNEKGINTFEKLYNESLTNKLKKEEKIKKYLDELKFTPNIEMNDKYKIKSSFEDRRLKSLGIKEKYRKVKMLEDEKRLKEASVKRKVNKEDIIKRLYDKEMEKIIEKKKIEKKEKEKEDKKKKIINWKKVFQNNNEKYLQENDYKKYLEKRKKFLESINLNKDDKKNNVVNFNDFLKNKENNNNGNNENNENNINNNNNDNEDEDDKEEIKNNENDNLDNIEEHKATTPEDVQEAINDAFKSSAIKKLLNNIKNE